MNEHPIMAPKVTGEVNDAGEVRVRLVQISLCELCLLGKGGECHVPGCALWLNRAPDLAIHPELYEIIEGICRVCGCTDDFACGTGCAWVNDQHTLCSACVDDGKELAP